MTETADFPEPRPPKGWLDGADLDLMRAQVPFVYLDVIPVRVDNTGAVTAFGLLLCSGPDDALSRSLVSGRIRYTEHIREALYRLVETDLGPMAFAQLPPTLTPFTVVEYLPDGSTGFCDPRQHAISLGYILPVLGDCTPTTEVLSIDWLAPEVALSSEVAAQMVFGQGELLQRAARHLNLHS